MNRKLSFMAMLVCVLALGLAFAGCKTDDDDDNGGGGPSIPSELVGKWKMSGTQTESFEIKADGTGKWSSQQACTWTESGGTLTIKISGSDNGSVKWKPSNGKLTLSGGIGLLSVLTPLGPTDYEKL